MDRAPAPLEKGDWRTGLPNFTSEGDARRVPCACERAASCRTQPRPCRIGRPGDRREPGEFGPRPDLAKHREWAPPTSRTVPPSGTLTWVAEALLEFVFGRCASRSSHPRSLSRTTASRNQSPPGVSSDFSKQFFGRDHWTATLAQRRRLSEPN